MRPGPLRRNETQVGVVRARLPPTRQLPRPSDVGQHSPEVCVLRHNSLETMLGYIFTAIMDATRELVAGTLRVTRWRYGLILRNIFFVGYLDGTHKRKTTMKIAAVCVSSAGLL